MPDAASEPTPAPLTADPHPVETLRRELELATTEGIAELSAHYRQARDVLAPDRYAQASGISPAAFVELTALAYQPSPSYPALLRLGNLSLPQFPLSNFPALREAEDALPYYHDLGTIPNLLIDRSDRLAGNALLCNIALRLLASLEAPLLSLHFVDATELGRVFGDLGAIAAPLRPQRILTEAADIEQLLKTLKADAVGLIQDTLGNRFANLQAYNAAASALTEPYRFLFIADFPQGFSPPAVEVLLSLMGSAARSGLAVFMTLDREALARHRGLADTLRQHPQLARLDDRRVSGVAGADFLAEAFAIHADDQPAPAARAIVAAANRQAQGIEQRVVRVALPDQPFTRDTRDGIGIPIGLSARGEPCLVRLGAADSPHHGLIGGTTGSGKSVLLHNLILNGAWLYAPDELRFLLLDYKEGAEFKPYERLPHVEVLAIESSRAFGLSVFEYLQEIIRARGALFKAANVSTLTDYRAITGEKLPRLLLVIDEFQVLIKTHDTIGKKVIALMDDVARRGRGIGIHMILSTQTLLGVELQESTLSSAALRIGLRMTEGDAVKVFHRDNLLPAGLRRAGEAWLNEAHGQRDGNVRLQVAWLAPQERQERLGRLAFAAAGDAGPRHIFTGAGHAELVGSPVAAVLRGLSARPQARFAEALVACPAYLGDAPLSVRLLRQDAANILMVGESTGDASGLALLMLYQFLRQSTEGSRVYLVNGLAVDSPDYDYLDVLREQCPQQTVAVDSAGLEPLLETLAGALTERAHDQRKAADRIVLCLMNAHQARCFKRAAGGLGVPAATKGLETLLREGPRYGLHVLLYCQRYQGFQDLFQNPTAILNDFENRLALFGGNSERLFGNLQDPVQHPGTAYIATPRARFGSDPAYLYRADDILNLFADLTPLGR